MGDAEHLTAGAWAKRYHLASRGMMERILRPFDLGSTQWYVLYQLANHGPTPQRDLLGKLQIEKPTLSEVVAALVRKGWVEQQRSRIDQRQRVLVLTDAGRRLWASLPDPIAIIRQIAFHGFDRATLEAVVRVLQTATERLNTPFDEGADP